MKKIKENDLLDFCLEALKKNGMSMDDAYTVSKHLVNTD